MRIFLKLHILAIKRPEEDTQMNTNHKNIDPRGPYYQKIQNHARQLQQNQLMTQNPAGMPRKSRCPWFWKPPKQICL